MKKLMILVAAVLATTGVMAQLQGNSPIPTDKSYRVGKLENGMTYYIRHNEKPKNQADFYIVHDVGAIQENDSQQGLAHFLEHMAFNGTKNLPDKMLIEYLEKIGVKFGANLNAATSWDTTVYNISDVPTTREGVVDSALLILHDWSQFIALKGDEINSERGVIKEELRTRDGAQWRSTMNLIQSIGKGSKYEQRNLIGSLEGLSTFPHEALRNFYHTWYRPDYQAVIIVGDVDVDVVEAKIKSLMKDIAAPAKGSPRKEQYIVPDNDEQIVSVFEDKEMQRSYIQMFIKRPATPEKFNNRMNVQIDNALMAYITTMGNARLQDIAQKPNAPFLSAQMTDGSIGVIPTLNPLSFFIYTKDGELATGYEAFYTELERMRRHGFTMGEFERTQKDLMSMVEKQWNSRNDKRNEDYVNACMRNFTENYPLPSAEDEWKIDSTLLNAITLEQVNTKLLNTITSTNQVIVANAPIKDGIKNPTPEDFRTLTDKVLKSEIAAYEDKVVKEPLISAKAKLKGSKVKSTTVNETFGMTEWTLKNGIKIFVKPTKYNADEIIVNASTLGGCANMSDEDYYTCQFIPTVMNMSGISKFSASDLRKQLSGKNANVGVTVDEYETAVQGTSSVKDLETMLQLLYLNFTAPRFSQDDFNVMMEQYKAYVANLGTNPDFKMSQEVAKTVYNDHPRRQSLSVELLNKIDFNRMAAIHKQLFSNAGSYKVVIIGNVDMETLKPLVEKYIGSLPVAKKGQMSLVDDNVNIVKGKVDNFFTTPMQQPKVGMNFVLSGKADNTIANKLNLAFLTQALDSRYLTKIREEMSASYGAHTSGNVSGLPYGRYNVSISLDTNEAQAEDVKRVLIEKIEEIAKDGPTAEELNKTREYLAKTWKASLDTNYGWHNYIDIYLVSGLDYISNYEAELAAINAESVKAFANKMLNDGNLIRVVMSPAKAEAATK